MLRCLSSGLRPLPCKIRQFRQLRQDGIDLTALSPKRDLTK